MINIRRANSRGQADLGWLKSQHTFSFASYYNPKHMGVSALRVINEDIVKPGGGFDTHGHKDMEILSYVISGTIAHKDSQGNVKTLPAGEFQLMSAGSGIFHSEYNASTQAPLHFLQIWIKPDSLGGPAGYQQKAFEQSAPMTLVVSPDGADGTLKIKQDARVSRLILASAQTETLSLNKERLLFIHIIEGELQLLDAEGEIANLTAGDAVHITELANVTFRAGAATVVALVFDLP